VSPVDPRYYTMEPTVRLGDYGMPAGASWDRIDQAATAALGVDCIGVPSVRVGLCWVMEHLGLRRHTDHVLVPRFMGECILKAINRQAFPVEQRTEETRLAVVVHQYGLRQDLDAVSQECRSRGIRYIEDGAYGFENDESPGPGSMGKLLALTKTLPVLKGALLVSDDQTLVNFMKMKRRESSRWSWYVLASLAFLRRRRHACSYSTLAGSAYDLYLDSKGDNSWIRKNILRGVGKFESFSAECQRRLSLIESGLGSMALIPDTNRLVYAVPLLPGAAVEKAQEIFHAQGFDPGLYHVDVARNIFNPSYEKHLLLPINPRIPSSRFDRLIDSLSKLDPIARSEEGMKNEMPPLAPTGRSGHSD